MFPKPSRETERESGTRRVCSWGRRAWAMSCHAFNAKRGPSFPELDLITSPERLREQWFRDFLIAPQSRLPGVVMPESWPGGVAVDDETLGGDTDAQIGAIWHFLTLGRSAPNPRGIDQPRWNVDVEGAPRVYRGRGRVAGFRGVAVGFLRGCTTPSTRTTARSLPCGAGTSYRSTGTGRARATSTRAHARRSSRGTSRSSRRRARRA